MLYRTLQNCEPTRLKTGEGWGGSEVYCQVILNISKNVQTHLKLFMIFFNFFPQEKPLTKAEKKRCYTSKIRADPNLREKDRERHRQWRRTMPPEKRAATHKAAAERMREMRRRRQAAAWLLEIGQEPSESPSQPPSPPPASPHHG